MNISSPRPSCRRQAMLAAVATALLVLVAPHATRAETTTPPPPHAMADSLLAGQKRDKAPGPVSDEDLAKAKADIEKLRALPAEERAKVLYEQRVTQDSPANFEAQRAQRQAREAYIRTLPEAEREALRKQMHEDRQAVHAKMKEKWDAMTPEQRAAEEAKRKAEFDKLPDDVKKKMQDRRKHALDRPHKAFDGKRGPKPVDGTAPPAPPASE